MISYRIQYRPAPDVEWDSIGDPCESLDAALADVDRRRQSGACWAAAEYRVVAYSGDLPLVAPDGEIVWVPAPPETALLARQRQVRTRRVALGIGARDLAAMVGIRENSVYRIERGEMWARPATLYALEAALRGAVRGQGAIGEGRPTRPRRGRQYRCG